MPLATDHPRLPQAEYARRYAEVRRRMRERGLDVLIVYGDSGSHGGNHANVKYLSNYQDPVASYLVVPLQGEPALYISNRLYLPYARRMSVVPETDAVDYDPAGKVERRIRELG
ncbi:MAG: aminopeptidase P family N-terminal domain-containing protein, partial [Candidatus Rokuibacteriota bacterium]